MLLLLLFHHRALKFDILANRLCIVIEGRIFSSLFMKPSTTDDETSRSLMNRGKYRCVIISFTALLFSFVSIGDESECRDSEGWFSSFQLHPHTAFSSEGTHRPWTIRRKITTTSKLTHANQSRRNILHNKSPADPQLRSRRSHKAPIIVITFNGTAHSAEAKIFHL